MITIPQHIFNDADVVEIFLVTPKRCYRLNRQAHLHYVHPAISSKLTQYDVLLNMKDGSSTTIVLQK